MLVRYDPHLHDAAMARLVTINDRPENVIPITLATPTVHFSIARPEDLALLDITFYGFTLKKSGAHAQLVATTTKTATNWVGAIVQFPPQHIGEGDYAYDSKEPFPFDPAPVLSQMAGPSRLAFAFKTGDTVPMPTGDVADLLDWSGWNLSVVPGAQQGLNFQAPSAPQAYHTAIECPLALLISPVIDATGTLLKGRFQTSFHANTKKVASPKGVTECWTTQLGAVRSLLTTKGVQSTKITPPMSAVWAKDYANGATDATGEHYIQYDRYVVIT
jgi:hypothetical protein